MFLAEQAARADAQRPSMGQDINKGRRTETDAINGLVARRGLRLSPDLLERLQAPCQRGRGRAL